MSRKLHGTNAFDIKYFIFWCEICANKSRRYFTNPSVFSCIFLNFLMDGIPNVTWCRAAYVIGR